MKPTRPVIPYFGGKWKIADWICSYFPKHRIYIEPFGGAASVLMRKEPSKVEIYNDLNDEIVNLFRILRDPAAAEKLRELLNLTPYARTEWQDCSEFSTDPIEQARRTIVISVMSCNSGKAIRRQSNGMKVFSKEHTHAKTFRNHTNSLKIVTQRLQNVIIENHDAVKVMTQNDTKETLHFVDPPYLAEGRKDKTEMYSYELLTGSDHQQLAEVLRSLKGSVVLSGYPSDLYKELFEDFGWKSFSTKSSDGSSKKGESLRTEVIWLNPKAYSLQIQKGFFSQHYQTATQL